VDVARQEFLARAALALDEDGEVWGGAEAAGQAQQRAGLVREGQEAVRAEIRVIGPPQNDVLVAQAMDLEGALEAKEEFLVVEGFLDEIVCPALHRLDRLLDVAGARVDDDLAVWAQPLELGKQVEAVTTRHGQVEHGGIRLEILDHPRGVGGVLDGAHRVAVVREETDHVLRHIRIVVNDQDVRHLAAPWGVRL